MTRNHYLAGVLSLLVPGLGQIYAGKSERCVAILLAMIAIGNLNAIWLSLFATSSSGSPAFWASILPRVLHRWFVFYGVIFWIWQVVDAYRQARPAKLKPSG